jgi:hypothetical protein
MITNKGIVNNIGEEAGIGNDSASETIVHNGTVELTQLTLRKLGLNQGFKLLVGRESCKIRKKFCHPLA